MATTFFQRFDEYVVWVDYMCELGIIRATFDAEFGSFIYGNIPLAQYCPEHVHIQSKKPRRPNGCWEKVYARHGIEIFIRIDVLSEWREHEYYTF